MPEKKTKTVKTTKAKPVVKKETAVKAKAKPEKIATDMSGKYIPAIGRRKTAVAQVRLFENGQGNVTVNGKKISEYFPGDASLNATTALRVTSHLRDYDISVIVHGGGKSGQVEAVKHGITRALVKLDEKNRDALSTLGLLTRDKRKVERKKPGLRKARKSPQWSKR
jgi:small subunit ribosomal protein S9